MTKIEHFKKFGYYIEKDVYSPDQMKEIFCNFYDIAQSFAKKDRIQGAFPNTRDLSYPKDLPKLDDLIMAIFSHDKDLLGEIYDAFSYSFVFMRFLSDRKVESIVKELLEKHDTSALYGFTNRMRIDPPRDERRTYSWHQEVFYTIPETRFLQTWCPMMRDTTVANGTIEIKVGLHKEGIAKQSWNEIEGRALQIIVDPLITEKYKTLQLEMKVGDVMFFDPLLAHRSGHNSTNNEVRFSLVGMWNDIEWQGFRAPKPEFKSRTISAKEYYYQKMKEI